MFCRKNKSLAPAGNRTAIPRSSSPKPSHYTSYTIQGPIGITWLITVTGGGESTVGIRNFNLRRSQVIKMGKIRLNQSLIYNDLRHRKFTAPLFLCKWVTQMSLFCLPHNADFIVFPSLDQPNKHLENISIFLFASLQPNTKTLFLGRKNIGGALAPLSYTYARPSRKYDCYEEFSTSITTETFCEM
jgi:hypothetical protein